MGAEQVEKRTLIFTYGTLKQGFSNHCLVQDMMSTGDAVFLGVYRTVDKLPMVCGPFRVPFLLNFPGLGDRVWGELYAVSDQALSRMDELEGTTRGHYERLPIKVQRHGDGDDEEKITCAEAYYAHGGYAEVMWKRNGEIGYSDFNAKVAKGYVYRKDRPKDISFLEQIRLFVSSDRSQPLHL